MRLILTFVKKSGKHFFPIFFLMLFFFASKIPVLAFVPRLASYESAYGGSSPLDLGGFLGNIGGFWELLIICWGVFFIATRDDHTPRLIARDLTEPVKKIIRRRSLSVDSGTSASQGEERPAWESAYRGDSNGNPSAGATRARGTAAAAGFPVMPPVNSGTSSANDRRRIVSVFRAM